MAILQVAVTHSGFEDLVPKLDQFQLETLALSGEFVKSLFEEWMNWDRPHEIITEINGKDTIIVQISNEPSSGSSSTDSRSNRANVPSYVNFGTNQRFAVLSVGFSPKTAVGIIASSPGHGHSVGLAKKSQGNIKARKVDEEVADETDEEIEKMIDIVWDQIFGS